MIADTIKTLLQKSGIIINGPNPWDISVHNPGGYVRVFRDKNLGLGESYMEGWWDSRKLDEFFCRVLSTNLSRDIKGSFRHMLYYLPGFLFNLQTKARARIISAHHYNLGNELFFSFLDPYNQYSCGFFDNTDDLNTAQMKKLKIISDKLELKKEDHLLDIGCGWGGLAKFASEQTGCRVTGVNISENQLNFAEKFCANLPVNFINTDYRSIKGNFSKIVSVGMFEHAGQKNYRIFMKTVHRCLKDNGIYLLHTIGSNISSSGCDPWITRYIFPNGKLPSIKQIAGSAERLFIIEDIHNIGPHYDRTLTAWNNNFQQAWPQLKEKNEKKYDEKFKRMWEYYLLSCAGAFRARDIQTWQILMTKYRTGTRQPACRNHPLY